jgi:hypothetical protein
MPGQMRSLLKVHGSRPISGFRQYTHGRVVRLRLFSPALGRGQGCGGRTCAGLRYFEKAQRSVPSLTGPDKRDINRPT